MSGKTGKEHTASAFDRLVKGVGKMSKPMFTLNRHCGPPNLAVKLGYQTDGTGHYWCAVADTQRGLIPGKAKGDTCWFPYDGKEHITSDFYWLDSAATIRCVDNTGAPPVGAILCGKQTDGAGNHFPAIALTQWGRIPGKAKDNTCWYPYDGKEYFTSKFQWITAVQSGLIFTLEPHSTPPKLAFKLGYQTDGAGDHWCAVADTQWGLIPGKAKGDTCWFPYDGKEHTTANFYWLDSAAAISSVDNIGAPPVGAILCGNQTDGAGDHYAAIALTQWGKIPGKAKDNTCWYPYNRNEYVTSKFQWITAGQ